MIKTVQKYNEYVRNIKTYIDKSPYKSSYIVKELGIPTTTFYRKLKENTFTLDEVEKLTRVLFPKEAYYQEIIEGLQKSEQDIIDGRVVDHEEVMKRIRKKLT